MKGHWKFLGGGGTWKAKILEAKYETKLEFLGEGGVGAKQKPSVGGVGIFLELQNLSLVYNVHKWVQTLIKINK